MGMSGGSQGSTMADINVTPLVDVMLVLLIIFMVTAPMLNNAGVEVDLPKSEAPPLPMEDQQQLILSMNAERMVFLNDQDTPFSVEELLPRLRAIAEANPEQPIFLRADGSLPYREVVGLLDVAKRAGMPKVGLVFDPTGAGVQEAP
ncbi:MAG TPA: ExbD/TolR family protein [Deltaproteobacteria bacterium]|nr:ExbD/TolR family protein [Deltaproteobacteria bacterium]